MMNYKVRHRVVRLISTSFLAVALTQSVSYSNSIDPDAAKALKIIEECKMLSSTRAKVYGDSNSYKRRIGGLMSSIYSNYDKMISLPGYGRICVMTSVNPLGLESAYREWEVSKKLQVLHELITFTRILAANNIKVYELPNFVKHIIEVKESCKQLEEKASSDDVISLRVAYWKLRFIEPAFGVKEMLPSVETKIEIASVRNALRETIDKGKPSAELEQRIVKLPADAIKDIENYRSKLLDEKAKQVAMAKEEESQREKALKRQQEIDEAIKLRKEEIDAGKTNPTLEQRLSVDSELKGAVALWEGQYKKELADKKAWEAKKKLEEIQLGKEEEARRKELATAEEVRKRETEIAERRKKDGENRIKAKLIRYNVKAQISGYDLHSNPFAYEGQSLLITLRFDRMIERTMGVFTSEGHEILVSKLPTDLFTSAGQFAELIVKVKGTTEVSNLLGARFKVPYVEYIDVLQ